MASAIPNYKSFLYEASVGVFMSPDLERVFDDRQFIASSERSVLTTLLLGVAIAIRSDSVSALDFSGEVHVYNM